MIAVKITTSPNITTRNRFSYSEYNWLVRVLHSRDSKFKFNCLWEMFILWWIWLFTLDIRSILFIWWRSLYFQWNAHLCKWGERLLSWVFQITEGRIFQFHSLHFSSNSSWVNIFRKNLLSVCGKYDKFYSELNCCESKWRRYNKRNILPKSGSDLVRSIKFECR